MTAASVPASALSPTCVQTRRLRAIFALYTLTGFSGVLAEQGFERYTSLLVGATAAGSAVVLFTYFLGFALGGFAGGTLLRRGRISRPLLVYGLLELAIGSSCALYSYAFHPVTNWMAPLQNLFNGAWKLEVRFASACVLVLPTAALMGASFPLIAGALDAVQTKAFNWPRAYAANLLGALAAAVLAPFVVMPFLGLRAAMWICFAIGAAVCIAATRFSDETAAKRLHAARVRPVLTRGIRLLLLASFASGAVFFALEVLWTHLIGVVIGCSVYAFSWMLAAVLLGLLLGARFSQSAKQKIRPALVFQCAAILLIGQLILWDHAPLFFTKSPPVPVQNSFYFAEFFKLYITFLLLVPASTALGLIYPSLLASPQLQGDDNSYLAGYIGAANSVGCLIGAALGIFVLVPHLGSELSLKVIAAILAVFWLAFEQGRPRLRTVLVAVAMIAALGLYRWDWNTLTAGYGNYYGSQPVPAGPADPSLRVAPASIVFRHEDTQGGLTTVSRQTTTVVDPATTAVRSSRTVNTLLTNGKFQGDDDPEGQINAQFGFAAIPSLFTTRLDDALLIGLGTAHSATTLRRLGYRTVDVAEFSRGIVQAAATQFATLNESVLSDPQVHLYLEDGRNVLLTNPSLKYDLITIEISSVWFAGATNLYSREFYELLRGRLKPGGVLQQWIQLHHIGPDEISCDLATVRSVFPHAALYNYGRQGMLIASMSPLEPAANTVRRLQQAGVPVDSLAAARVLSPDAVDRLIAAVHPRINTDHNRWLEYATPRYQSSSYDWMTHNLEFLSRYTRGNGNSPSDH